ncbi:MAG: MMPL family transporter [Solirubrobacterales bacterium]|nr:MMPL family transporter [Solirubrobacterales bacterium]
MLGKLATFVYSNRRRVLFGAVIFVAIAGAFGVGLAKRLSPYGAEDPATQSVQAMHRYQAAAGRQIDPGIIALVRVGDLQSAGARRRVGEVEGQLRASRDVAGVLGFYESHDPAMVSRDGRSTYVVAYFRPKSDSRLQEDASHLESRFAGQRDVKLGGLAIANAQANSQVSNDLARAELLAFPLIFLLSLLFFRSLVAALLPPLLGGLAIVTTFFALRIVSQFADLSVFALNLVTGLSLGLAIDYSLFMVSRYREESAARGFGAHALRRTLETSGRTILFSSLTVAAAIASLTIFPQRFLYSMGIAGALVPLIAVALALSVLPALLAVLGPRVNALAPRWLQRAADRDTRPAQSGFWYRLSRLVMRRPGTIATITAATLIALGIPFASIRFLPVNASVLPASASARQVDDALRTQFAPGRTSPLEVVVAAPAGSPRLHAFANRIRALPDVAAVAPAQPAGRGPGSGPELSLLDVAPSAPTYSAATKQLVHAVRALPAPFHFGVSGQTAAFIDLEHSLGAHLPLVLAIVIASTLIILFLMTGSVVLPVKAVLMNALGLSAVFGILVLIFQHGNLQGLLSYRSNGALDATQPILLFVIGFGLATDYGVFLLSRIKEARDGGLANSEAVALGLERTGRIVTAAALLFAVAIGAFTTSKLIFIKELGLGTALAVLIDATVIRALLVPSLMELLGEWNWWAPAPLRRLRARSASPPAPPPAPAPAPAPGRAQPATRSAE